MPRVKLKNIVELAEGTMGFYFEKPAGFQFSAGQFGEWTLIDPPETDPEGNFRTFTIASAPAEEDLRRSDNGVAGEVIIQIQKI